MGGAVLCPFRGGGAGSPSYNMAWAEHCLRTKWHLDPSSRLTTADRGPKLGAVPLSGELGPRLTQCGMGRGAYLRTNLHLDALTS